MTKKEHALRKKIPKKTLKQKHPRKSQNPKSKELNYSKLITNIENVHYSTQCQAVKAVNILLTFRNWLVGYYLVEYEQNGKDRANYGKKLLKLLASELKQKRLKGFSITNLRLYRLFYRTYPQIVQLLYGKPENGYSLVLETFQSVTDEINIPNNFQIHQSLTDEFGKTLIKGEQNKSLVADSDDNNESNINPYSPKIELLLQHFTFTHFAELIKIKEPMKRAFYEIEGIKGNWSVRQLKRQIESLFQNRISNSIGPVRIISIIFVRLKALYNKRSIFL